jgi:hypothetical protein
MNAKLILMALFMGASLLTYSQGQYYTGTRAPDRSQERQLAKDNAMKQAALQEVRQQEQVLGPPVNDECTGAVVLTHSPVCTYTNGTVQNATQSRPGCSGTAEDDVWFRFTATETSAKIIVEGSVGFDAVLEVFSGNCGFLNGIVCMDETYAGDQEVTLVGNLVIGQTYYIRVYDYYATPPSTLLFGICVTTVVHCIPSISWATAENEFCGADINGGCNMPTPGFQNLVPGETVTGDCWSDNFDRDTDWFRFHLSVASPVDITIIPEFPVEMYLMEYDNCVSSPVLKAVYGPACDTTHLLDTLAPGDYMVFVANETYNGYPCGTNNFYILKLYTDVIQNDVCANAIQVQCGSGYTGTTTGATTEVVPVCNGVSAGAAGVWYRLPGSSKITNVSLCANTSFDTRLQIYTGGCGTPGCFTANDNFCSGQSEVEWFSVSGVDYYIYVNGGGGATGDFELRVLCTCPPPEDGLLVSHTSTSATLSWTQPGNPISWDIEAGLPGFVQDNNPDFNVATNPGTVSPLAPNREFDFYVRSVCGALDKSEWIGPFYMNTMCPDSYVQPLGIFESAFESYASNTLPTQNCQLADDFIIPDGECWTITGAKVMMIGNTLDSVNLWVYDDASGVPGSEIAAFIHPAISKVNRGTHLGGTAREVMVTFPAPLTLCGGVGGTTYWLSCQAIGSGPLKWEVQTTTVTGNPAVFRNPGGGISSCTTWTPMQSCLGSTPSDAAFRLFMAEDIPPVITCPNDTVIEIISGIGAIYTYSFSATDNCAIDTTYRITGVGSGGLHPIGLTTNTWVAEDPSGNKDTCDFTVSVVLVIGIEEQQYAEQIRVFPNPSTGIVRISFPENCTGTRVSVFSIDGKEAMMPQIFTDGGTQEMNIGNLAPGLYFIRMEHPAFTIFRKIVKESY